MALEGYSLREQVLAGNLANLDTPGYQARWVTFAGALREALAQGRDPTAVRPQVVYLPHGAVRNDGNNVDVDQQMTLLAETGVRYQVVAGLIQERYQDLRTLTSGGVRP